MKTFESVLNEYNSLPSGNVYIKVIKGNTYFYYQFSDNGKKITKYISKDEYDDLLIKINHKKELSKFIKENLKDENRSLFLSNSARNLTGYLMLEDKIIGEFENGQLIKGNEKLLPLIIKRTKQLNKFLQTRVIDTSRTNARLLKKALNIHEENDELLSIYSYAVSITDNYWFKPKKSKLKYKDVQFKNDVLFDVSLKGSLSYFPRKVVLSPELTTGGSFEKGWKRIDNEWWLYKVGTDNEKFSELFYATLLEELNIPTAHYELDDKYIRSKNFAVGYNYEPMYSLMDDNDDYNDVLTELMKISKDIARQYMVLIYFDALLNNVDRHNENYGLLKDKKTGSIISLAPNFDNNLCLISRNEILNCSIKEGFLSYFLKFLKSNQLAKDLLKESNLPRINESILNKCFNKISIKVNEKMIREFILSRQKYLFDEIFK